MRLKISKYIVVLTGFLLIGVLCLSAFGQDIFPAVSEEVNACGKKMTPEMKAQRALDILEIQNVAGMHEYYHSALCHQ